MSQNTNFTSILIVDDNCDNIAVLSDILSMEEWQVSVALDPETAIEQLGYCCPDLILLDVMMPKIDGYQTCKLIKANPNYSDIPVIFITALFDAEDKIKGFNAGAVDYISKPFNREEVLARVRIQLKISQLTKTLASQNIMLKNALEQEKKLNELKSRFVTMASHEFRTPLASILSSAELLEYYGHKWSEEKKLIYLHRIQSSVGRMSDLLNDILILGKSDAEKLQLNPTKINLPQFCRELVEEIQLTSSSHQILLKIDMSWEDNEVKDENLDRNQFDAVYMDEKILRHILNNLLSNAIKYSPDSDKVIFELICQSERAIFQVRDFGIGFPLEDKEKLFDSFYRANNADSIPGTGLGLTIVKKSVDLYGGTITANSESVVGTTFTVTLPYLVVK